MQTKQEKRWRPLWGDANAMDQDGADLRGWVQAALETHEPGPGGNSAPVGLVERASWEGLTVRIEDLDAFKRAHGLRAVRSTWPANESRPVIYFCEVNHDQD